MTGEQLFANPEVSGYSVRLEDVEKWYGGKVREERPAVHIPSLSIRGGEWAVLMGDSGSGKSTLLNLVGGVDLPDSGKILLGDNTINQIDERERTLFRRKHMGFVFQFFNLFPTLSVRENVMLPLGLLGRRDPDAVGRLLEEVGLSGMENRYPSELSGGEQQRVALARALVHRPQIILADEPTGSLDHRTGMVVLGLLQRLHREYGPTILMSTHSEEAARFGERVLHIRDGEIMKVAPVTIPDA